MAASDLAARATGPGVPLRQLAIGLICGLIGLVMSIGNGNLLFSGALGPHAGIAIGMSLVSTALIGLVAMVRSSVRGVIATSQAAPIAALALPVGMVTSRMAEASETTLLATAVVAVALSTMAIGLAFFLLGLFRLGRFVRFVPYPVIGGFLAGTGWLIVLGGFSIVLGKPVAEAAPDLLASPVALGKAGAALAMVLVIFGLEARVRHTMTLPAVMLVALAGFNLTVLVTGIPTASLERAGWLLALESGSLWPPLTIADLTVVDWSAVLLIVAQVPVAVTIAVLALPMNMSGLEIAGRHDIDLDRELRTAGAANLLAGAAGGLPGYPSLSLTALAHRLGGEGPLIGGGVAVFSFVALGFGRPIMDLVPTPIFGGLLIWVGASLLYQWLVRPATRMSRWEHLTILLIFAVIVLAGFAWGVALGILAAVVLFAVEYGRIDIVRHILTGREYQSNLDQSDERRAALQEHGGAILIIRLQGFLFFGTADRLRRNIQRLVADHHVRFLLIDFRRVTGLDSSAVFSFVRLSQLAERDGFLVVLTALGDGLAASLSRGGLGSGDATAVRLAADLDHALEDCENKLLAEVAPDVLTPRRRALREHLSHIVPTADLVDTLLACFERVEMPAGTTLVEQGSASDDLFLIESGRAAIVLNLQGGSRLRLAGAGPGAIVGEISFYVGKPRTASVVAETPLTAWRLTRSGLAMLEERAPAVVAHFHRGLATMLAERLTATNRLVRYLAE